MKKESQGSFFYSLESANKNYAITKIESRTYKKYCYKAKYDLFSVMVCFVILNDKRSESLIMR